jgi:hypothetical protein
VIMVARALIAIESPTPVEGLDMQDSFIDPFRRRGGQLGRSSRTRPKPTRT